MTSAAIPRPPLRHRPRLMRELLNTPERALDELATYGPVCALGNGPLRMVIIGSPTLVRELLLQPNDRFRYDVPLSPFPTVVGQASMLASDGPDHQRRRGAVAGSLSRRSLERWIPMIVERTDATVDAVLAASTSPAEAGDGIVDLYPAGRRLVLDIVVRALFGAHLIDRLDEIDELQRSGQVFLASPLWRQRSLLRAGRRARALAQRDRRAFDALIDEAIGVARSSDDSDPPDVLARLVQERALDDAEIRDQVKTLVGAGFDTTASTLAWTLWEATLHPGLWTELRAEADRHLGVATDADGVALAGLAQAGATMREALRLHPASGIAVRTTAVDLTIGGHQIRRGTLAVWSPYLAGRDPATWSEPTRFDPSRFLAANGGAEPGVESSEQVRRAAAHEAWLPFGRGARMCVGFALAQMELTLIVARMAQRLDLVPTAPAPPEPRGLVVSVPATGAKMHVRPRPV